jgi:3-oxoacyl-(acyl-carrier-protein) synthase
MSALHRRRVVVTGIGSITPLGATFVDTWLHLRQGHSGVVSLTEASSDWSEQDRSLVQSLSCQVAAPVLHPYPVSAKNSSRVVHFALAAAEDAVRSAGLVNFWETPPKDSSTENDSNDEPNDILFSQRRQRTGVSIGTGMSGVRDIVSAVRAMDSGGGG